MTAFFSRMVNTFTLVDQPLKDNKIARITSPFTVEAVPAPYAKSLDDIEQSEADYSFAPAGQYVCSTEKTQF